MTTLSVDAGQTEKQLVVFDLATELYGVDIGVVREIIRMQELTTVPESAAYVEGVINLRGKVTPVIDLRKRLSLPVSEQDSDTRIVVVDVHDHDIGVIVDAVAEVLRISSDSIEPTTSIITTSDSPYILGIAKLEDRLIILLDLEEALSETRRDLSAEASENEVEPQTEVEAILTSAVEPEAILASDPEAEPEESEDAPQGDEDSTNQSPEIENIVLPAGEDLLWSIYGQLFSEYPEVKPVFSDVDMHKQKDVLLEYMTSILENLDKPKNLKTAISKLVEYHRLIGLRQEHHTLVGKVLQDTFGEQFGDQWTDKRQGNWEKAYGSVVGALA